MHRDEQTDGGMCYMCPENKCGQGKMASIYTNNDQHPSFVPSHHRHMCQKIVDEIFATFWHIEQNVLLKS